MVIDGDPAIHRRIEQLRRRALRLGRYHCASETIVGSAAGARTCHTYRDCVFRVSETNPNNDMYVHTTTAGSIRTCGFANYCRANLVGRLP